MESSVGLEQINSVDIISNEKTLFRFSSKSLWSSIPVELSSRSEVPLDIPGILLKLFALLCIT